MSRATGQLPLSVFGVRADDGASGRNDFDGLFSVALFMVFITVVLVSLLVGTRIYSRIDRQQAEIDDSRLGMSLLVNYVRATDAADSVGEGEGPEGKALVLMEHLRSGTYETRIYLYQGQIVEEYAPAGKPYAPAKASQIMESGSFKFDYTDGLLTITTDAGSAEVALRCAKGGA